MYSKFLRSCHLKVISLKPTLLISELRINTISKNLQLATYSVLNISATVYVENSASNPVIYYQV